MPPAQQCDSIAAFLRMMIASSHLKMHLNTFAPASFVKYLLRTRDCGCYLRLGGRRENKHRAGGPARRGPGAWTAASVTMKALVTPSGVVQALGRTAVPAGRRRRARHEAQTTVRKHSGTRRATPTVLTVPMWRRHIVGISRRAAATATPRVALRHPRALRCRPAATRVRLPQPPVRAVS